MSQTASIKDVATHAQVAVGTVSNVLNYPDRVSQRTKERVLKSIAELGFVRNDAARQLRAGQSRTIGLIVLDVGNPFFSSVARAAEDAAAALGSVVLVGDSGQDASREAHYMDLFQEQRVQGLLISPVGDVGQRIDTLRERGVPTVLVDELADTDRCSSVSVDDEEGGYLAAKHLLDLGRRRLAFVGTPSIRQVASRLKGAQRAVSEVSDATIEVLDSEGGQTVLTGRKVGNSLVERSPARAARSRLLLQRPPGPRSHAIPDDAANRSYSGGHRPHWVRRHRFRHLRSGAAVVRPTAHRGARPDGD